MANQLKIISAALFLTVLAGCGGGNEDRPTTKVYKFSGALFCGTKGVSPAVMQIELTSANIPVRSFACGVDGLGRNGICGTETGEINIFEIPESELAKAQTLAFRPFSELFPRDPAPGDEGREVPCPPP